MHTTFDTATQRITQAQADKERFRRKWESNCMYTEDLEATNARCAQQGGQIAPAAATGVLLVSAPVGVPAQCKSSTTEESSTVG